MARPPGMETADRWTPFGAASPQASAGPQALAPAPDGPVMVQICHHRPAVLVWRWDGAGWTLLAEVLTRPGGQRYYNEQPLAYYDERAGTAVVGYVDNAGTATLLPMNGTGPFTVPVADANGNVAAAFDPATGRTVLHASATTVVLDDTLVVRRVPGPRLRTLAADPVRGSVIGLDVHGGTHRLTDDGWRALEGPALEGASGLAHCPARGRIVGVAAGGPGMTLHELHGDRWLARPESTLPVERPGALLGSGPAPGSLLLFGGYDRRAGMGNSEPGGTWRCDGAAFHRVDLPLELPLGRYTSPVDLDGTLAVVNHSNLSVRVLHGDRWRTWAPAWRHDLARFPFDDRELNFAADGTGLWMLDDRGALWRTDQGRVFRRQAPADGGPGARYSRRVAMAFDAAGDRLVLVGGERRNDTWAFAAGQWTRLATEGSPPHGAGVAAATPVGVYLFSGPELWLLEGTRWSCVATAPDGFAREWDPRALWYEPRRRVLFAASTGADAATWAGRSAVWVLAGSRFVQVAELPEAPADDLLRGAAFVGLDPVGDRLVAHLDGRRHAELALGPVPADAALPTAPVAGGSRRISPAPADWLRPAVPLVADGAPVETPCTAPEDYYVCAVIPAHELLPMGAATGLAICLPEDTAAIWEDQAVRVLMLTGPVPAAGLDEDGELVRLGYGPPFLEPDPAHWREIDSPPRPELAIASKIGGFAGFRPGGDEEKTDGQVAADPCRTCGGPLRFGVQLAADLVEIGDCGALYVFVCANGCSAVADVQSL